MELRDFAEQVLFATSLEEKLRRPGRITDEKPGSPIASPEAPGRPAPLRFKPRQAGSKSDFPGLHRLANPQERGKLLHFFANHELLATELMALVLLKFPDAPAAFRKGVLQTLQDEQEHTRLYLQRMQACGVAFGQLPVNGYFWRCVAPMENPLDYVASLCLTFEQANLDFARHFARGFAAAGDAETAGLLERICRDEIGHVAYGLKWFRRWKHPDESDWEAFCRALKFPLSPQRAKGLAFNAEARRAAGLDPQFIAELQVFSQSKGRTPNVFVFNPFAEGRIAEGNAFNPTKLQTQLARDLENLPQFLCRQDDVVLVHQKPSLEFLNTIRQAGFALPEFVEIPRRSRAGLNTAAGTRDAASSASVHAGKTDAGHTRPILHLAQRKLGSLRPWAWGPDSFELLKPLFESVTGETRGDSQRFNDALARLYSKAWSAAFLRAFLSGHRSTQQPILLDESTTARPESAIGRSLSFPAASAKWLCTETEVGVAVNSAADALDAIAAIRERGHHRILVKEALGLAGSNAMRLFEPELLETHRRWMAKAFEQGRQLVVEPWLERALDFSIQLEMSEGGLKLCGFTGLLCDAKGRFLGNWAESHHHTRIPARVVESIGSGTDISTHLLAAYNELFALLETELRRVEFIGPIGIDAFVYRDAAGATRLKPVVEINPRYTMGRLLVELMKNTRQGSCGMLRLVNPARCQAEGFESFAAYAQSLRQRRPVQLEGDSAPKIRSGAVCLNDPAATQVCLAIFEVGRTLAELGAL